LSQEISLMRSSCWVRVVRWTVIRDVARPRQDVGVVKDLELRVNAADGFDVWRFEGRRDQQRRRAGGHRAD